MRIEKVQLTKYVSDILKESDFLFFITYKGLSVANFTRLRDKLYAVQSQCHVLKNSLIRIGIQNNDMPIPSDFKVSGDTSLVFGKGDPCSTAKILKNFRKDFENLSFKGGFINGEFLKAEDAEKIADLPSKEILLAQFLGVLQAPMTNLLRVFNGKKASLVYLLQSYLEKKEKLS